MDAWAKFEEIPSWGSCDIVFTRMGETAAVANVEKLTTKEKKKQTCRQDGAIMMKVKKTNNSGDINDDLMTGVCNHPAE